MPVRVVVTEGTRADCKEARALIDGLNAAALLSDRGYDTDEIVEMALKAAMGLVIPPKKNRKSSATMINICINYDIWLKMPFCILSDGEGSRHVTQSAAVHFLL